jgi:hypothetical protein
MSTYALVTKAPLPTVVTALRAGRVGGFVAADAFGTVVLFDAPNSIRSTSERLVRPARRLVDRLGVPAWLLLGDEYLAEAFLLMPGAEPRSLQWVQDYEPPTNPVEYLTYRRAWESLCGKLAEDYGAGEAGAELARVREDPVPGRDRPLISDLLRRVCQIFNLPDVAVGRSLLDGDEPGLFGAERVEGTRPRGLRGLLGRAVT